MSTKCTLKTEMKSEPIDDVEIGDVLVPEIRDESEPKSSDDMIGSDPAGMEVSEVLRPMLCEACGFETVDKIIFEDHVRAHSESRLATPDLPQCEPSSEHPCPEQTQILLACTICNFIAREQSDLLQHMNSHIKNEIPNDPVPAAPITVELALSNEPMQLIEFSMNDVHSKSSQPGETVTENIGMPFSKDGGDQLRLKVSGEYNQDSGSSKIFPANPTPNKRFTCDVCGYKTNKKVTFEDHLRTHTGEKPFACDLCPYRSSSKHTLGKHKKIHTRPKPFKCDSCEYRGSTRSDLSRHQNIHSKSHDLHNGDSVPSEQMQIGTPVMIPLNIAIKNEPPSDPPDTTPQTVYTIFSYNTDLTNVEPNMSTSSSDAPPAAPKLVLLNSATLDGFRDSTPTITQPTGDVLTGSRTESSNDPLGNDSIPDGPSNDPLQMELSDELSQDDDTSNSLDPANSGNQRFKCNSCSYTNSRRHDFEVHLRTHTGETPFACDLCDKKYIAKKTLNRHKRAQHGEQQFGCLLCDYRSARKSEMDEHVRSLHNEDGNANDLSKTEFEAQYEPANDQLELEPSEERRDDSNPSWTYEVLDTGNKLLTCFECGFETQEKSDLDSHMMAHTGEKLFACEFCDKKYTASRTLNEHLRETHGEKLLHCELCDYRTLEKSHLVEHVKTHLKTEGEILSSEANTQFGFDMELNEVSNYSGPSESSQPGIDALKTEYETYEPANDPLQLSLSEEHSQDSSLSRHSEAEVVGSKRFKCDVCGYKTSRKYEFTVHMRTHTGEKPYGCSLCDYRSIKRSYVNKHMKTHLRNTNSTGDAAKVLMNTNSSVCSQVESNEPKLVVIRDSSEFNEGSENNGTSDSTLPVRSLSVDEHFTCEHCEYRCDDLTAWSQHMFEHTREKSFSCGECEYQTKDMGSLTVHRKVHTVRGTVVDVHPVSSVTITCEFCDYPFTTRADMSEHIMACHPEKCPHGCDLCDFKAFSVRSLELHKETHARFAASDLKVDDSLLSSVSSSRVEEYICYSCDFKASTVEAVEQHISTSHNLHTADSTALSVISAMPLSEVDTSAPLQPDVQEYLCYACDFKASEVAQVEEHILSAHSLADSSNSASNTLPTSAPIGLEEFVCYACDFKACSVAQVQQHIQLTHNSESNAPLMEVNSQASSSVAPL